MSKIQKESLITAAVVATVITVISYQMFKLLISALCDSSSLLERIGTDFNRGTTAVVLAGCTGIFSFLFSIATGGFDRPERIEKLACLVAFGWGLIWFGYMFANGDFCYTFDVRAAVSYLFVPIGLIALAVSGRRWMSSSND